MCYDVFPDMISEAVAVGAAPATSPEQIGDVCKTIITMLPSGTEVSEVYNGENGVLKSISAGSLLLDCSTISPTEAKQLASQATIKGVDMYDAPVSGGVVGAKNATLSFMIGGPKERFDEVEQILLPMGKKLFHIGTEVGMGQSVKICNNMLLAIEMIGVAEALNLGKRLGIDPKVLSGVINQSTGRCWSTDTYNPVPGFLENVPAAKDYDGGFMVSHITKDLGLAQSCAVETSSAIPLGSLAHQIYRILISKNLSRKDFGVIYKYLGEHGEK